MGSTTFKGLTTFEGSTTLTLAPDEQFSVSGITELNELRVMGSASIDYLDVMGLALMTRQWINAFGLWP